MDSQNSFDLDKSLELIEERLKDIEQRESKATPAPWEISSSSESQEIHLIAPNGDPTLQYGRWNNFIACYGSDDFPEQGSIICKNNADFVSNSRSDIPYLLSLVDYLKEELLFHQNVVRDISNDFRAASLTIELRKAIFNIRRILTNNSSVKLYYKNIFEQVINICTKALGEDSLGEFNADSTESD